MTYDAFAGGSNQSFTPVYYHGRGLFGGVSFSAPLNSRAMGLAARAEESGGPPSLFQHKADAKRKALSHAQLEPYDGGGQYIIVRCSRS